MTATLRTLKNGVRVVCDPMPGLETLALSVVAGRGAAYEDPARSGWSHLLEHMVFKGAGQRSARDIVEVIESAGGSINAATGYERTSFQVRALKGGLDLGMDVIADLVRRPTLDPADLAREKQVVAQEIAEAADAPDDYVFDLIQRASWGDHPVGRPILGSDATVEAASVEALSDWRGALYAADRLVVSATGAVDEAELMAAAERAFGDLPATPGEAVPVAAHFIGGPQSEARKLEQSHLVFMLPACGARDHDYFALRIFAEVLGGGMSSRLFQEAREKRGLAYNIDAYADTYADHGALGIYVGCAASDAVETAKVCAAEVEKLVARIDDAELARAKAQLKAHMFMAREQPLSRAEQGAGQVLLFDRLYAPAELAGEVDAVTADDVARLGRRLLADGRAASAVLGAKTALKAGEAFDKTLFSAA
ncbi:pitrilysin family protein [Caulobacter segnis]|uniref:M16 family metallopeptidase n=1 Tax=Caulobacter segnis TaxID=88688 RepID=UPI00285F29C5|nr:pitrilysin family protein [Caulobacter segnis]MDR6627722.1 putative Zn-dependent peptidase [Caulobacter segnis]